MTTTPDELLQDAYEHQHGYDVDVACTHCSEITVVRFRDGEPVDESSMACPCGGGFEEL